MGKFRAKKRTEIFPPNNEKNLITGKDSLAVGKSLRGKSGSPSRLPSLRGFTTTAEPKRLAEEEDKSRGTATP